MMSDSISQKNINAEKVVGRDDNSKTITIIQYIKNAVRQPLRKLINKLRKEIESGNKIIDTEGHPVLNFYQADIDTIGLEGKMKKAKKEDKLKRAMAYKELFVKELTNKKFYRAGQELYAILLGKVYSGFNQQIKPLIEKDEPTATIDAAEAILIDRLTNELGDNADIISFDEIEGMLYYLTGKCHIKWHKE